MTAGSGPFGDPEPTAPAFPPVGAPTEVRFLEPRRRAVGPRVLAFLLSALLVGALLTGGRWWAAAAFPSTVPPPGVEEAHVPLGEPPLESALDTGAYAFTQMQPDGSAPVTYSPCRPIHYVVRPDNSPPGGDALIAEAVARVSYATGLRFVLDGPTDEAPDPERAAYQPDRYGKRWAPVLITWSNATETASLAGDVAGTGGSAAVTRHGHATYVTGAITLDADEVVRLQEIPNGTPIALGVITHELGHVVGLAHVQDPTQLMYPATNMTVTTFAAGDRAGLAILGRGECVRDV